MKNAAGGGPAAQSQGLLRCLCPTCRRALRQVSRSSPIKPRCRVRPAMHAKRLELTALQVSSGQPQCRRVRLGQGCCRLSVRHRKRRHQVRSGDRVKGAALTGGKAAPCRWLPDPSNDELTRARDRWRRDVPRAPIGGVGRCLCRQAAAALTAGSPAMRPAGRQH
jgi:hypothetical protein